VNSQHKSTTSGTTRITALNQLDKRTREKLKRKHPGFISELARKIERHHSQVSKLFNGRALSKSAYIETALIKRINELLSQPEEPQKRTGKA